MQNIARTCMQGVVSSEEDISGYLIGFTSYFAICIIPLLSPMPQHEELILIVLKCCY